MIKQRTLKTRPVCKVTFELDEPGITAASVVGDFNGWDAHAHPMRQLKDGRLQTTIELPAEASFQFRYLLDGGGWRNEDGGPTHEHNSVLQT